MGVQSGLIATNGSELAALKLRGERNYFEFKLGKTKQPQRVGDITLLLKKTDPKKNKYTVEVMADDKLTEKKDRNINEPVQFYTAKAGAALRTGGEPGAEEHDRRLPVRPPRKPAAR